MKFRIEFDYQLSFAQTIEADDLETAVYTAMKTVSLGGKATATPDTGTIYIKRVDER